MYKFILTALLFLFQADVNGASKKNHNWQANGGELAFSLFYDLLSDFGIEVNALPTNSKVSDDKKVLVFSISEVAGLDLFVPIDGLQAVPSGNLSIDGTFTFKTENDLVRFVNLSIQPVSRALNPGELTALDIVNEDKEVLFHLNHIHARLNENKSMVEFNHMDLTIGSRLADQLGKPHLKGMVIGGAQMNSLVSIPTNYEKDMTFGGGVCVVGGWPDANNPADVQLIDMTAQYRRSIGENHVVFTPSATLKNVGSADVAWYRKFTGVFEPYLNDQHPYLYWSMYREIDDRFEQIGHSGVKHAFFTVNTNCGACRGGQVLFPQCEDLYSVANNDGGVFLGPKSEVEAFNGLWESTGSFFDQDGDGQQDIGAGSNSTDENRMVVAEADFADSNLPYFIASWYLIRDDVDIFNSMGYRGYEFSPSGDAWLSIGSPTFNNGPASDQYVAPGTFDLPAGQASQRILQQGQGHLTLAVKVIDNNDGTYRYNYMIENHDYDPQVQTINIPLPMSSSMTNLVFSDVDEDLNNDWAVTRTTDTLTLQAPLGNAIDWGTLYSFSFTTDSAPQLGYVLMQGLENNGSKITTSMITPFYDDLIYASGFEILN